VGVVKGVYMGVDREANRGWDRGNKRFFPPNGESLERVFPKGGESICKPLRGKGRDYFPSWEPSS